MSISEPHHEPSHCLPQLIPNRQQAHFIKIKPIKPTQKQHMLPNNSMMELIVNLLWCRKRRKLPNSSKTGSNFKSLKTEKDYQHLKLMLSMLQQGILCSTVINDSASLRLMLLTKGINSFHSGEREVWSMGCVPKIPSSLLVSYIQIFYTNNIFTAVEYGPECSKFHTKGCNF